MNFAVVGATGLVGQEFLKLLKGDLSLKLFASPKSKNKKININNEDHKIDMLERGCFDEVDISFFSAGSGVSKKWANQAVSEGSFVIDNSSAFRMDKNVPLVVPEVNGEILNGLQPTVIANPNCSTIQMVVALNQIHKQFGIKSIKVATYQSISGAGSKRKTDLIKMSLDYLSGSITDEDNLAFNNIPQIGDMEGDYSLEEMKMQNETRKIFNDYSININAFCVRTPTINGHSEAVWFTLKKKYLKTDLEEALSNSEGVIYKGDGFYTNKSASGKDGVFVSRLRQDLDDPYTWSMWIVSDNLLKGAALNGYQIARVLMNS